MKRADIIKAMEAGTEVAVVDRVSRDLPYSASRAVIVAVGQKCRGGSTGRKPMEDGIRVRSVGGEFPGRFWQRPTISFVSSLRGDEYEDSPDRIVSSRQVYATWADYEAQREAQREAQQAASESRARLQYERLQAQAVDEQARDALIAAGVKASVTYGAAAGRGVLVSAEDAQRFAAMLREGS